MANIKISEEKINIIKDICKSFGNRSGEVICRRLRAPLNQIK